MMVAMLAMMRRPRQHARTCRLPLHTVPLLVYAHSRAHAQTHTAAPATQAALDAQAGPTPPIPPPSAGRAAVISAVVAWVHAAIASDRKVTALKQLQGHVWRTGFQAGQVRQRGRSACTCKGREHGSRGSRRGR